VTDHIVDPTLVSMIHKAKKDRDHPLVMRCRADMRAIEAEKAKARNDTLALHLLAVSEESDKEGGDDCGHYHTSDAMYSLALFRRMDKKMVGLFCAVLKEVIEKWAREH